MFGPVLKGKKVTLRPPVDGDAARFIEWFADLEVTRYLGTTFPLTLQAEEDALRKLGESKNDVFWCIEAEGRTIGASGIHRIDWIDANAITGTLIGDKTLWRRGLASEAMALRTDYAFRQLNLHKLSTEAFVANEGSWRALKKAGYTEIGVRREQFWRDGRWHDVRLGELLRADWERERTT